MTVNSLTTNVTVSTSTAYIEQQSDSAKNHFVFAYKMTISNKSSDVVQLLSRHWIIKDANQKVEEVFGEGVIGEQPVIQPGESYTYTSGAVLETEMGTMEGKYFLISKSNDQSSIENINAFEFEVAIPKFTLTIPRVLH